MTKLSLLLVVSALLAGCDDGLATLPSEAGALGGGAGDSGGMGGGSAGGAGGAAAIGDTFTRADHELCEDWPVCPDGIIDPANPNLLNALSATCRAGGALISCGPCIDTRTAACAPFIGRCKAPNWPTAPTAFCADRVPPPRADVNAFTICTGELQHVAPNGIAGWNARTVCDDTAP